MGKILEERYLAVDFIVEENFDLSTLVDILKKDTFLLWSETNKHSSSFGTEPNLTGTDTSEKDIVELLRVIENLPTKLTQMLQKSHKKKMSNSPIHAPHPADTIPACTPSTITVGIPGSRTNLLDCSPANSPIRIINVCKP
ncbi:MAG: hypothetical protein FWC49_02895 [Proteobacteria bacterium]|nr:hypothetical protein [Pseudomonadota bacterium]